MCGAFPIIFFSKHIRSQYQKEFLLDSHYSYVIRKESNLIQEWLVKSYVQVIGWVCVLLFFNTFY